jgi:hypothetical protein
MTSQLDHADHAVVIKPLNAVVEFCIKLLLCLVAIGIIGGAVFLMVKMSEAMQEQGGRYLVAVGAFVLLIGVDTQFTRLAWRRFQLDLTAPGGYQRYTARATLVLAFAGVFLFTLAFFMP